MKNIFLSFVLSTLISYSSAQSVGIGNNAPLEMLHIGTFNNSANTYLEINTTGGSQYKAGIKLRQFNNTVGWTLESDDTQNRFLIKRHPGDLNGLTALSIHQGTGNIGIGTTASNAPLQFISTDANRKIVLKEDGNNDHQFYGLGVNASVMRYQIPAATANHVFYSGINSTSSKELLRIGNGLTSVGSFADQANNYLQVNTAGGNSYKAGLKFRNFDNNVGWTLESDDTQNRFLIKRHPGDLNGFTALSIHQGTGNIGIGTTASNAPLQFTSSDANRKIVLKEVGDNDHQFYGIGVNPSAMRYQSPATTANHVFYSGINSSSSMELLRIGNGFTNIGTYNTASNNYLHLYTQGSGGYKTGIKLRSGLDVHGFTLESDDATGRFAIKNHFWDVNGTNAFTISQYDGNVGIGGNPATEKLKISGDVVVTGILKIGYVQVFNQVLNIPPGIGASVSCTCPTGTVVIGGGYAQSPGLEIIRNSPITEDTWIVNGINHAPVPGGIDVYAICARMAN